MNLLDRYVAEVGKRLPRAMRADIETEIRSTLQDMLADRSAKADRPVDDALIGDVLREYGAPDKVAAGYLPARYLIGPRLYPTFTLVLRVVGAVLVMLAAVGLGLRLAANPLTAQAAVETVLRSLAEFGTGLLAAFGNIVFIFAILERVLPASEFEDAAGEQPFNPAALMAEPEPDHVGIAEPLWTTVFTLAALLVFNFYPQVIGLYFFTGGGGFVPALSPAFFQYLPWINVLWVLEIGLQVLLLRQRRWQPLTRWLKIGLSLLGIVIAAMLLRGPSLLALTPEALVQVGIEAEAARILMTMFGLLVPAILVIVVVAESVEIVKNLIRLLPRRGETIPLQIS